MARKIKDQYTADPTAGDDETLEFYYAAEDENGNAVGMKKSQLSDAVASDGAVKDIDDRLTSLEEGVPPTLTLATFTASVPINSLTAELVWSYSGSAVPAEWIVKEDDTDLPNLADAGWESAEIDTFNLSNYNPHTLTARVKDSADNISNPITVQIEPSLSTLPTIASFTVVNPDSGSTEFTFNMTVTGSPTHRIFVYNDNTVPALSDAGWVLDTFPITAETANLDELIDSTVYAYVKTATLVSPAVTSFVDVTIGGDTAANGDWLHVNNPTIPTFNSSNPIVYSGSGTLTIDGTSAGYADAADGTDGLVHFLQVNGTYSTVNIHNMDLTGSRLSLIHMDGLDGATITIRNCKLGTSNRDGETSNQQKKAIVFNDCKNSTINVLGNWFDMPDGCIQTEDCDGSVINIQYNFCSGMVSNGSDTGDFWKNLTNFYTGRNGNVTGQIKNNIYYAPNNPWSISQLEDVFNLHVTSGTSGDEIDVQRNRIWSGGGGNTGTCFQIGDKNYNGYVWVDENTAIDTNGLFMFSLGHHHKFINNKGYQSELNPSVGPGFSGQLQRRWLTGGKLSDCTVENNTVLWFHDPQDGGALQERGIYYPVYGRDTDGSQGYPNHGTCTTCDVNNTGNLPITGLSNNVWSYPAWANGQGKSELWRESWKTFSYAGADGLTPIISHDSPWVGDGGSQNFSAQSITSTLFGDEADVDDIQTHDVLTLAVGGVSPYSIVSATAVTNCSVSVNATNVVFTAGSTAGAFTYQYTLQDDSGAQAIGTITGTLVGEAATSLHFDQNGQSYISIDPTNYHEYFPRAGAEWDPRGGQSSPDDTYMQCIPYNTPVDIADVETNSCELVFRVHFDASDTYTVYIRGAAKDGNYDTMWVGFEDTPDSDNIDVLVADPFNWEWVTGAVAPITLTVVTGTKADYTFHCWKKDGGFALGKILIVDSGYGAPADNDGPAQSPEILV